MIIERVRDWDGYSLYKASWRGLWAYGTTRGQAIGNMLGIIEGLKWDNYEKSLI